MPTFIKPRHSDDDSFRNHPVNLNFCKNIHKREREGTYQIRFVGCETAWIYRFKGNRDAEFAVILQELCVAQ